MLDNFRRWLSKQISAGLEIESGAEEEDQKDSADNDEDYTYETFNTRLTSGFTTWEHGIRDVNTEKYFREITAETLEKLSLEELTELLIKTDPSISRIYEDFVTFATLDYDLTCENPRGQAILDGFEDLLTDNYNSLGLVLDQIFGSIVVHGTYCFELIYDQLRAPIDICVIDTDTLHFRTWTDSDGRIVRELGQYDENDEFILLDPQRVFYDAMNLYLNERKGHSMIAAAFPSAIGSTLMQKDLQEYLHNQAWVRKYVKIDTAEMIAKGMTTQQAAEWAKNAREQLASGNALKDPSKMPVFVGSVDINQAQGTGGSNMNFVDSIDRVYDRKTIRGGGASPSNLGSNEFTAESSAKSQGIRDSRRTESFQKRVEKMMSRAFSRPLQAVGITEPAMIKFARIDVLERDYEAEIFQKMMYGIKQGVEAGYTLITATRLYESQTGTQISPALIEEIEQESEIADESQGNELPNDDES